MGLETLGIEGDEGLILTHERAFGKVQRCAAVRNLGAQVYGLPSEQCPGRSDAGFKQLLGIDDRVCVSTEGPGIARLGLSVAA